jgi:hypothetical protein
MNNPIDVERRLVRLHPFRSEQEERESNQKLQEVYDKLISFRNHAIEYNKQLALSENKIIEPKIQEAIAKIFCIKPSELTKFVSGKDLESLASTFDGSKLVVSPELFKTVILNTYITHKNLKQCDLRPCQKDNIAFLVTLFTEVVKTGIQLVCVPRKLTSQELRKFGAVNGDLFMQDRSPIEYFVKND